MDRLIIYLLTELRTVINQAAIYSVLLHEKT